MEVAFLLLYAVVWAGAGWAWGVGRERRRTLAALVKAQHEASGAMDTGRMPSPAEVLRCVASHVGIEVGR